MALSKTQQGLALIAEGTPPRLAAQEVGVAESTLRMAMGRTKGKTMCPCCGQVVREGFELRPDPAAAMRDEIIAALERSAQASPANASVYQGVINYVSKL